MQDFKGRLAVFMMGLAALSKATKIVVSNTRLVDRTANDEIETGHSAYFADAETHGLRVYYAGHKPIGAETRYKIDDAEPAPDSLHGYVADLLRKLEVTRAERDVAREGIEHVRRIAEQLRLERDARPAITPSDAAECFNETSQLTGDEHSVVVNAVWQALKAHARRAGKAVPA